MNNNLLLDRSDVLASAKRAADGVQKTLPSKLQSAISKAIGAGMLHSGAHIRQVREIIETEFHSLCKNVAIRTAEICGEEAPSYYEQIDDLLRTYLEPFLQQFVETAWPGMGLQANEKLASEQRILLENELSGIVFGTSEDLRLGIADGKRVENRKHIISIDNRGGAGQIAVNSPGAVQTIGGNQSVTADQISQLITLIETVRKEIASAQLDPATREQIEDLTVSVEREIKSSEPQKNRLKRMLFSLRTLCNEVGIKTAATIIADYISQLFP